MSKQWTEEQAAEWGRQALETATEIIAQVALYAGMPRGIDANMLLAEVLDEDEERREAEGFFYRFPRES